MTDHKKETPQIKKPWTPKSEEASREEGMRLRARLDESRKKISPHIALVWSELDKPEGN